MIFHGGATAGYRAQLETYPELDISIAWLTNTSQFDTSMNVVNAVRELLLTKKEDSAFANDQVLQISVEKLKKYEGLYKSGQNDYPTDIIIKNKKLTVFGMDLIPDNEHRFRLGSHILDFDSPKHLKVIPPNSDPISYFMVDSLTINNTSKILANYIGSYYSTEANASYTVRVQDNELFLYQRPLVNFKLIPLHKDRFAIQGIAADLFFARDNKGQVIKILFSTQRSANVEFMKSLQP